LMNPYWAWITGKDEDSFRSLRIRWREYSFQPRHGVHNGCSHKGLSGFACKAPHDRHDVELVRRNEPEAVF
jgi:hypothetical protein